MIMPSYTVLPASTLAPSQIGLSGLGQDQEGFFTPEEIAAMGSGGDIGVTHYYTPTPTSTPSPSSPGLSPQVQAALIQGGFNLANLTTIRPGTTLSPTGAISQQTAGYPIGTLGTSLTASGISSMLPLIAVVAVALILRGGGR